MLRVLGQKGHANQNNIEISIHSSQNGYHQSINKNKRRRGCGKKEPIHVHYWGE
jgi:hypothetical protein